MTVVGLTGGIGSGKSTVAALLDGRGAVVLDADAVVRELQEPGRAAFDAIVGRFGPGVLAPDGTLDRAALAQVVFADPVARGDLEALVHPAVAEVIRHRVAAHAGTDRVVVLVVPLLVETGRYEVDGVVVVDCAEETAVARLVERQGMAAEQVRARIRAQATRAERLARADHVIDNSGSLAELEAGVDRAWAWIESLPTR
ncbi:MAG: dephospho-CoA kinase [Acidimicrobiales bacterium]